MSDEFIKAMQDREFWKSLGGAFQDKASTIYNSLQNFGNIPAKASDIADNMYVDSARDSSRKNAFRHALGTGMMTQALGGTKASAGLAKLAGYAWEGMGIMDYIKSPEHRLDTAHDLNANAIGAQAGASTSTQEALVARLKMLADSAIQAAPPKPYESALPYLTHTVK